MKESAVIMRDIKAVIEMWSEHIATEVMTRWMQIGYKPNLKGEAEVKTRVKKQAKDVILMEISGIGQRALMMEYGRGSEADMLNPYLQEYIHWSGFNSVRIDSGSDFMAIKTRKKGKYKDLDGNTHDSLANRQGKNLENTGNPKFQPEEPHHVIRNIVCGDDGEQGVLNAILDDITEVILLYDFFKKFPSTIKL